jgi:hypothetical protein
MVSLAATGASAVSPHVDDCHDSACLAMAVEHDADAHHMVAPPAGDDLQPLHCLVCHWLRSFRPRTEARVLPTSVAETGTLLHVEFFTASAVARAVQPPLRAPPVSPFA